MRHRRRLIAAAAGAGRSGLLAAPAAPPRPGMLAAFALILTVGVLVGAGVVAMLAAIGLGAAVQVVAAWLPIDPAGLDPLDAVTVAAGLTTLAIGIARRKRLAWLMTAVALGAAGVAQVLTFGHPIGAALAAVCLVVLVTNRPSFRAGTAPAAARFAAAVAVLGLALLALDSAVGDLLAGTWQQPAADLQSLVGTLTGGLSFSVVGRVFGPSGLLGGTGLDGADLAGTLLDVLELAARIALVVAAVAILAAMSDGPRDTQVVRRARALGRRYGRGALSSSAPRCATTSSAIARASWPTVLRAEWPLRWAIPSGRRTAPGGRSTRSSAVERRSTRSPLCTRPARRLAGNWRRPASGPYASATKRSSTSPSSIRRAHAVPTCGTR
jgi:hypothetical protein